MGWMEGEMFAMAYLKHTSFSCCGKNEGEPRPIIIPFNHNEHPIGRISGGGIKGKLKGAPSHPS